MALHRIPEAKSNIPVHVKPVLGSQNLARHVHHELLSQAGRYRQGREVSSVLKLISNIPGQCHALRTEHIVSCACTGIVPVGTHTHLYQASSLGGDLRETTEDTATPTLLETWLEHLRALEGTRVSKEEL